MLSRTRCAHCKKKFTPEEKGRGWELHEECIWPYATAFREKLERKRAKAMRDKAAQERKDIRARKAAIKTIPDLLKEAQREFNAFIRERDKGRPCICCGHGLCLGGVGGGFDCGHYRSVGSAPHLRFNEDNAHGQRKVCNRYGAGRAVDYRIGLIQRIGIERVERLESDNSIRKWTREELVGIRDKYRRLARELKQRTE